MYRVGILGTENSHAAAFCDLINAPDTAYPDFKVTSLYALERAPSEAITAKHPEVSIADSIEAMMDSVDCVMVTARHGKYHKAFALPFIKAGKPAFIDKPFTIDLADTIELIETAAEHGVPLTGGSGCKYSDELLALKADIDAGKIGALRSLMLTFAVDLTSVYGGIYFYSSHMVEMMLAIAGNDVRSVKAFVKGEHLTAVARYDSLDVILNFNNQYTAAAYGDKGYLFRDITCNNIYKYEVDHFTEMVRTGVSPLTNAQLITPVRVMNALERSIATGREELV
ncbi:MAG: Gfo/Idh/MocA family oxidoreductase [Eubacteriales bacterium]